MPARKKKKKVKVEFRIDRRVDKSERLRATELRWESWDYWFTTELAARRKFDALYRNEGGEAEQDFRIVRVTEEVLPFKSPVAKSKKDSVKSDNARMWKKATIGDRR